MRVSFGLSQQLPSVSLRKTNFVSAICVQVFFCACGVQTSLPEVGKARAIAFRMALSSSDPKVGGLPALDSLTARCWKNKGKVFASLSPCRNMGPMKMGLYLVCLFLFYGQVLVGPDSGMKWTNIESLVHSHYS